MGEIAQSLTDAAQMWVPSIWRDVLLTHSLYSALISAGLLREFLLGFSR